MRRDAAPITTDIVLVGGGHAHALLLRRWGMRPLPGARLTLINPEPTAPYTGMLPGFVAGHYDRAQLDIDLVRLARFAGARLILDRATGLDRGARRLTLEGRPPVVYDFLSINIGIVSDLPSLPGMAEHAVPAKPLGRFAALWEAFVSDVAAGRQPPSAAVVGAGVGGVELAMAMAHRLRAAAPKPDQTAVTLIEAARQILPDVAPSARKRLRAQLDRHRIEIREAAPAAAFEPDSVRLADGAQIPAAFTVTAAGARPHPWLAETGLPLRDGFLRLAPDLRSIADPRIFAAGDAAHLDRAPSAKAGVYAVRQAPVLADNLARAAAGRPLRRYAPQRDYLKLVSTGGRAAVAEKWGRAAWSPLFWRWKDWIDRRFMDRLAALPVASPDPAPAGPRALGVAELTARDPLCGGCGSKLGPAALAAGLAELGPAHRADIVRGPGDDAALLRLGDTRLALTVDQFRAFVEDPYEFGRIAALHAMGDVWAMGARPQAALASLILPPMSPEKQAVTLREILAGLDAALAPEGAVLAGGHSAAGAELSVGVTVTGLVDRPLGLDGAAPGDRLLLTKPIGVGTHLAAEMRGRADGRDWAAALEVMRRSNARAAQALAPRARALTDVTGFGLAGHLIGMCRASGVAAVLGLRAIPLLEGAERLAAAGIESSLAPENRAALAPETAFDGVSPDAPAARLLLDPQTAGGLLAALPPAAAAEAQADLGDEAAWIIGEIRAHRPGAPRLTIRADYAPGDRAEPGPAASAAISSAAAS